MKKSIFLLSISLVTFVKLSQAQNTAITGTVKNDQGKPLPSALVQESDSKTATYTDSLGYFKLPINTNSTLLISCIGYKDEVVKPKDNVEVVLVRGKSSLKKINEPGDPNASGSQPQPVTNASFGFDQNSFTAVAGHGMLTTFSYKEETQGSRYLFNEWAKGYVVDAGGHEIKNDNYGFNYDKISGALLLTQDKRASVDVDKSQVKSFTVYNKLDVPNTYAIVPSIDEKHFTQVLSDGNKYKIYKYTKTKFVKSDYHSDGLVSTGNRYDEYVDEDTYYVYDVKTSKLDKITLRNKAIKQAFAADADKVKTFYSQHTDDSPDENFLKNLGDYLNE